MWWRQAANPRTPDLRGFQSSSLKAAAWRQDQDPERELRASFLATECLLSGAGSVNCSNDEFASLPPPPSLLPALPGLPLPVLREKARTGSSGVARAQRFWDCF